MIESVLSNSPDSLNTFFNGAEAPKNASGKPWWLLGGTGFEVDRQIKRFVLDYQRSIQAGNDSPSALSQALSNIHQDIVNFRLEYILRGAVLPISVAEASVDGRQRVVAPLYGNQPVLDTVTTEERYGAVYDGFTTTEDFLLQAPTGAMTVMVSPSGWSGLKDGLGRDIIYKDNQICVFKKDESGIRGFTFVNSLSVEESMTFLSKLGVERETLDAPSWSEGERLSGIVRNIACLQADNKYASFEGVVDLMTEVTKSPYIHKLRRKTYQQVKEDLQKGGSLLDLDERTQKIINDFEQTAQVIASSLTDKLEPLKESVLDADDYDKLVLQIPELEQLAQALGLTVLMMFDKGMKKTKKATHSQYVAAYRGLQALGGCAGGGMEVSVLNTVFGGRAYELGSSCEKIKCQRCGWEANDENAKKIARGELTCCPDCKWKPGQPV